MALSGHSVVMARAWHLYMPVLSPSRDGEWRPPRALAQAGVQRGSGLLAVRLLRALGSRGLEAEPVGLGLSARQWPLSWTQLSVVGVRLQGELCPVDSGHSSCGGSRATPEPAPGLTEFCSKGLAQEKTSPKPCSSCLSLASHGPGHRAGAHWTRTHPEVQ